MGADPPQAGTRRRSAKDCRIIDFGERESFYRRIASEAVPPPRWQFRIPLQHLLGSVGFCGLQLDVCSEVLIPRPETELLVETALKIAQEMDHADLRCLDMATGSGCIALSLAEALPESTIVGVDLSNDALKWAKHNAEKNRLSNRVNWVCSDLWESLTPGQEKWDIVTCNPPYIATHEIQTLEPEVRDHDPVLALDGGVDGLDFYRRIASEAVPSLPAKPCPS